jgi:hypothetical protein
MPDTISAWIGEPWGQHYRGDKEDAIRASEEAMRQLRLALQYRGREDREHEH